jgi:hypothetical protein
MIWAQRKEDNQKHNKSTAVINQGDRERKENITQPVVDMTDFVGDER